MRRFMGRAAAVVLSGLALSCTSGVDHGPVPGEGHLPVTGGKVWYRIVGTGRATPLLLLHGGPGFTSHYMESLRGLADERPVVFYDQLGAGRSEKPADSRLWRVERFVEEVAQVREALGLKSVHVLGHSWGTQLAVDYLLTGPKGVRSVILASPCLSVPRWIQDADRLRRTLPPDVQDVMARHEKAGTTGSEEYQQAAMTFYRRYVCRLDPWPRDVEDSFAQHNPVVYETMWGPSEFHATGNLRDYDRTHRLRELRLPVLYTAGRFDEATPEATRWYHELTPGSSFVVFENSSHLAMVEEPDRFIEVIRQFLREVERGA
jgi:proline iminopeptidase